MQFIGWLGSVLLGLCAVPQAIKSFRDQHSDGISGGMLLMWSLGEILTMAYILDHREWPLVLNYLVNIIILIPIVYFKLRPQHASKTKRPADQRDH